MKKYLRFYAFQGWVQASPPGTGSTTPTEALVDMSDFSMAMAFDLGGSHLRFINHDGTAFFTVEFQPTANDCWAQSLLTEINKTIVRAAGEGWQKVIYDIGEGVGNNPPLPPFNGAGVVVYPIATCCGISPGENKSGYPQRFYQQVTV